LKKTLITCCSTLAMAVGAMPISVHAQDDAEANESDVIVITGLRQSLEAAADIKRNSDGVVDAITAEDIGKFPDTNLAESLQRITGVSIDRQNGEGQQISVRGFGPGFNMVTLNGRQMPNASSPKQEGADTRAQVRAFNFAEIAADSVSAVEVYKTSRPDLPTGGIGATVNVQTARPLDLNKDYILSGSIKGQIDTSNEAGDDITPEITGIVGKTWDINGTDTFGVLFNGSYSRRDSREEIVSSDGWLRNRPAENAAFAANVDTSAVGANAVPGVVFSPRNLVTDISDHERTRTNGQLVLQYGREDSFEATLDYTYSDYQDDIARAQTAVWFDQNLVQGSANANGTLIDPTIITDGTTYGAPDFNAYSDEVQTTNKSVGFNFDWKVSDSLSLNFDVHDSESHAQPDGQSSDFLAIVAGQIGTSYTVDYGTGSYVPILDLRPNPGIDPYDPTALRGNITLKRGNEQLNEITEYNLRGKWENEAGSSLTSIDFGVGFLDYFVDTNFLFDLEVFDGGPSCGAACNDFVDVIARDGDYGDFSGVNSLPEFFLSYNAAELGNFLSGQGIGTVFEQLTVTNNKITEETTSAFFDINFEDQFNGMPFRATAGVRYETTETTGVSSGPVYDSLTWISNTELRAASAGNSDQTLSGEYDVWLPAIDTSLEVRDDMIVRLSYGRSLSRPDLNLLRPNVSITDTRPGGPYQAVAGNPALLPYISDNIDASFEWYYADGSYFSVAAFKKFVDNYITTGVRSGTIFSDALGCDLTDPSTPGVNPPAPVDGTCSDPTAVFDITSFVNSEAAEIEGVEIALQHLFGDTGFGTQLNYTAVSGDVDFDSSTLSQAVALTGLSDSANAVAFYDKNGFQARIAYNWRDEFLFAVDQLRQPGEPVFVEAYGQVDASASYEINERFTVFAEGLNLTDETSRAHGRFEEQFLYAFHGGPRYAIGIRGKF